MCLVISTSALRNARRDQHLVCRRRSRRHSFTSTTNDTLDSTRINLQTRTLTPYHDRTMTFQYSGNPCTLGMLLRSGTSIPLPVVAG